MHWAFISWPHRWITSATRCSDSRTRFPSSFLFSRQRWIGFLHLAHYQGPHYFVKRCCPASMAHLLISHPRNPRWAFTMRRSQVHLTCHGVHLLFSGQIRCIVSVMCGWCSSAGHCMLVENHKTSLLRISLSNSPSILPSVTLMTECRTGELFLTSSEKLNDFFRKKSKKKRRKKSCGWVLSESIPILRYAADMLTWLKINLFRTL